VDETTFGYRPEQPVVRIRPPGYVLSPADGERFLRRISKKGRWFSMRNGGLGFMSLFWEGIFPVPVLGTADPRTGELLGRIIFIRKGRELIQRVVTFWVPPEGVRVTDEMLEPIFQKLEEEFQQVKSPNDRERLKWRWGPYLNFISRFVDQTNAPKTEARGRKQTLDWACDQMERELANAFNRRKIAEIVGRWESVFERISQSAEFDGAKGSRPVVFFGDPDGLFAFLRLLPAVG